MSKAPEPTPLLLSWSGGKDAAWALHVLRQRADVTVVGLVTTLTEGYERIAMQGIRREILHAQAAACGLPVFEAWMPQRADNATYEASYVAALGAARARWPELRDIAFGDLYLADIRTYREALCAGHGWTAHFPIFDPASAHSGASDGGTSEGGTSRSVNLNGGTADDGRFGSAPGYTARIAQAMLDAGLRATLTCVDSTQLDGAFCGHDFDAALLAALPPGCDPCGENGEFHTLAHAGPMFATPLHITRGETVLRDGRFVYTDLLSAGSTASTPAR